MSSTFTGKRLHSHLRVVVRKPDKHERYRWHRLLMGNVALTAAQLRGAMYVFDRYNIEWGYAEVSSRGMAYACRMDRKTAQRVIAALQQRGLIKRNNQGETDKIGRPKRARFVLLVGGQATPPT